ncbi:hypothetical protein PRELSG_0711700 [Plasmodium relictum]|uniref:Uncharacterized protein n=1 Tax=Plasmodium relictum TaxID=85471 RepID=A0A1J1H457_PLARL|nr:hypothetical protein PRELSG_0711700 [Plasmodium relictum]CRG99353.1 hypothetical protein PRELSG_0711700 [Plasmodium relictum]
MIHLIVQVFSFNFTNAVCFSFLIFIILFSFYSKNKYMHKFNNNNNICKKKYYINSRKNKGDISKNLSKKTNNLTDNKENDNLKYEKKFLFKRKNKFLKKMKQKLFHNNLTYYNFRYILDFNVSKKAKKKKRKLVYSISNEKKKKINIKNKNLYENNIAQTTIIEEKAKPFAIFNNEKKEDIEKMLVDLRDIYDNLKILVDNRDLKEKKKTNLFAAANINNEKPLKKNAHPLNNNEGLNYEKMHNCVYEKFNKENITSHKNEIESYICDLFKIYKKIELLKDTNTYKYVCTFNEYCNFLLNFKVLDYLDICRNNNIAKEISTNLIQKVIIYMWRI